MNKINFVISRLIQQNRVWFQKIAKLKYVYKHHILQLLKLEIYFDHLKKIHIVFLNISIPKIKKYIYFLDKYISGVSLNNLL